MQQLNNTVDVLARSIEDIANGATSLAQTVSLVNTNGMDAMNVIQETVSVTNMAAITEEQSASTEMILASSEHLYEHAINIADNSKNVKSTANELKVSSDNIKEHMSHFKI